jgi:hypothetical protein
VSQNLWIDLLQGIPKEPSNDNVLSGNSEAVALRNLQACFQGRQASVKFLGMMLLVEGKGLKAASDLMRGRGSSSLRARNSQMRIFVR